MFAASLAFFCLGAASRGLWHADEHRIAEVARVMAAPGGDWIVPHLNGEVYTHKPPLVAWIAALAHGRLGLDIVLAARLPSILGGALATLATFLIGRRLYGSAAGLAAAVVLATAGEFDWICRRAQYDPLLAGFTTMALWFFVRSQFAGPDLEIRRPWRDAVIGSLCVGLGVMVKGPVAFVFTVPTLIVFAAATREWKLFATRRLIALSFVLLPAGIWLAFAIDRGGIGFARNLVVGRLEAQTGGDDSKTEPFWFYLVALPKGLVPWTFFLPAAVLAVTTWRRDVERRADLFAISWVVAPLVLMSFVPSKRDLYLLPLYPGVALCLGKLAAVTEDRLRGRVFAAPRAMLAGLCIALGAAAVIVASLVVLGADGFVARRFDWWTAVRGTPSWSLPILAIAIGAVIALIGWKALRTASPHRAFDLLSGGAILGVMGFAVVLLPWADAAESPRGFYEKAAAIVGDAPVARYGVDDFAGHWAMRRNMIPFVDTPVAATRFLADSTRPSFVVAERPTLDRKGVPPGTRIVLEQKLPLAKDLVLLTSE